MKLKAVKAMRKLRNRSGFTLAEMMMTVLILLLVSLIVATGMPAAKNAYTKVVLSSNAQVLLSTTVDSLRDELGTAWNIEKVDTTKLKYFSANTGNVRELSVDENKDIVVQDYVTATDLLVGNKASDEPRALLSSAAKSDDLHVTYDSVARNPEDNTSPASTVIFTNLRVYALDGSKEVPYASLPTLVIHVLSTGQETIMKSATMTVAA